MWRQEVDNDEWFRESPELMPEGTGTGRKGAGHPCRAPVRSRSGKHWTGKVGARPGKWGLKEEWVLKTCVRRSRPHLEPHHWVPFPQPFRRLELYFWIKWTRKVWEWEGSDESLTKNRLSKNLHWKVGLPSLFPAWLQNSAARLLSLGWQLEDESSSLWKIWIAQKCL